jgi:hypothetical protein
LRQQFIPLSTCDAIFSNFTATAHYMTSFAFAPPLLDKLGVHTTQPKDPSGDVFVRAVPQTPHPASPASSYPVKPSTRRTPCKEKADADFDPDTVPKEVKAMLIVLLLLFTPVAVSFATWFLRGFYPWLLDVRLPQQQRRYQYHETYWKSELPFTHFILGWAVLVLFCAFFTTCLYGLMQPTAK